MSMRRAKRGLTWIKAPFIGNGGLSIELLQPFSVPQRDFPLTCFGELENALVAQTR
jgi:hypothetical protein